MQAEACSDDLGFSLTPPLCLLTSILVSLLSLMPITSCHECSLPGFGTGNVQARRTVPEGPGRTAPDCFTQKIVLKNAKRK
jgi:hypothetical protein